MLPTINLSSGRTCIVVNVAAALAWFALLPMGMIMMYGGPYYAYGWIIGASVVIPLIMALSMRSWQQKAITAANETEKKRQRRTIVTWAWFVVAVATVALTVVNGGWSAALIWSGVFGEARLQQQADAFKGEKLACFIIISALVMAFFTATVQFVTWA